MSETNSDNKDANVDDVVAKKATAKKKVTTPKKNAAAEAVAEKPKAVRKTKAPKVEEVAEPKLEEAVATEADSVAVAPYMSAEKQQGQPEYRNRYAAIAASLLVAVTIAVIAAAMYFQDEPAIASLFNDLDSTMQTTDMASDESVASDVEVAQINDQVVQDAFASDADYQTWPARSSNDFDERRQQSLAFVEEAKRKHEARVAEMNQFRTASFDRMDQDRVERLKKLEALRSKTQQIQFEMQQKMQQAYDEFHSI